MNTRSLVVVAEASPSTGVGHFVRSIALARSAADRGWAISVAFRDDAVGWAREEVLARGWQTLDVPWQVALLDQAAAEVAPGGSAFVVDSYRVDASWLADLRRVVGRRRFGALLVIDDLGDRFLDADVVVNQNFGAEGLNTRLGRGTDLLAGPAYALLRPEIVESRSAALATAASLPDVPRRVLVMMGGTDPSGSSLAVAHACLDAFPQAEIEVVLPSIGEAHRRGRLLELPRTPDVARLMMNSDLVVTAAGSTIWELCCLARPAAAVVVAENQRSTYELLDAAGYVLGVGVAPLRRDTCAAALRDRFSAPGTLRRLAASAATLVDGRGVDRVLDHLENDTLKARVSESPSGF